MPELAGRAVSAFSPGPGVGDDARPGREFGQLLRRYRSAAGLTQEELAHRSGLSVRALSDMERGTTAKPFARSARLLADALQLDDANRARLLGTLTGDQPPEPRVTPAIRPRQLPSPVAHFVGRENELVALSDLLDEGGIGTVVISAIGGTAGVGKTALITQWAHRVADRFPDGQLYVNLRGYDPGRPLTAADALARFLRALGMAGHEIPVEEDERAASYRSLLTGRRILVVADNAGSAEQVRPLVPGTPGCVLAVTSRDSLAGLVARDGAIRLDLDPLPMREAVGLLRALVGARVDADEIAATALAGQCSRLPLALRVAAERAAASPGTALADMVRELADQRNRLDLLNAAGDSRTAVRAVFSWSYRHLDPGTARAFRLLGLHPGPEFDQYAVAALTGGSDQQARRSLETLSRAYLIQATKTGRHGFHDLMRVYAAEQAEASDGETARRAALTRLFDYYLYTAAAAMDMLFPGERDRRPAVGRPAVPVPAMTDPAGARAWLDAERTVLAAVASHTAAHGWRDHTTRLAAILFRYLATGGHDTDAITMNSEARRAAHGTGDHAAEADALTNLAALDVRQARYEQAIGNLRLALALSAEAGDRTGQARAQSTLGNIYLRQGDYEQGIRCHQASLAMHRETGELTGQARAHVNLGIIEMLRGRHQDASRHYQQALAIRRQTGDRLGEAHVRINLGDVYLRQGRYRQAGRQLRRALALFYQTGDRLGEAHVLTSLGDIGLRQGQYELAVGRHQRALLLCRQIRDPFGECEALNGAGEALLAVGDPVQARARHAEALALAGELGQRDQTARAHNGLASAAHALGDSGGARQHWQEALAVYTALGSPEAGRLRSRLGSRQGDGGWVKT
jgi:tetratricopeptide (TPR) repeat protein/transcriptional regulator with XRE-family HTH domain